MSEYYEFRFKINDLTLDLIPMARVLEYLSDLAVLVSKTEDIHLHAIESGSIDILIRASRKETAEKIETRVREASYGNEVTSRRRGAPDAERAYQALNRRLREDKTSGVFMHEAGAEIIRFSGGAGKAPEEIFGPFNQEGSLDGIVIRIGGINELVPVHLQSQDTIYQCLAARPIARELAHHIFAAELRVYGVGRWLRNGDGVWTLEAFTIRDFHPLNDESLSATIAKLRAVPGNEWDTLDSWWDEVDLIRNGRNKNSES